MPVPALIAAAGAVANGAMQFLTNSKQTRLAREMADRQERRQDYLTANSALFDRLAKAKAGYNPMADMGYPNVTAPTNSAPTLQAPQLDLSTAAGLFAQMEQLKQQKPLVDAQAKVAAEQAEAQRIENERNKSKDLTIKNQILIDNIVENGKLTYQQFLNWYGDNIRPVQENLGSFEARKLLRQYQSDLYQFDANDAQNMLKKKVADGQMNNSAVIEGLVRMPAQDFERLFAETNDIWASVNLKGKQAEYYDAQAALTRTEDELKSNSSLIPLIHKYIPEGGLRDAVTALVIIASSFTGINLGFKGKTIHNTTNTHTGDKVWVNNGK